MFRLYLFDHTPISDMFADIIVYPAADDDGGNVALVARADYEPPVFRQPGRFCPMMLNRHAIKPRDSPGTFFR